MSVAVSDRESVRKTELVVESDDDVVPLESMVIVSERLSVLSLVIVREADGNEIVTGIVGRLAETEGV